MSYIEETLNNAKEKSLIVFVTKYWPQADDIHRIEKDIIRRFEKTDLHKPCALLYCVKGYREVLEMIRVKPFEKLMLIDMSGETIKVTLASEFERAYGKLVLREALKKDIKIISMHTTKDMEDFNAILNMNKNVFRTAWLVSLSEGG